MQWIRRVTPVPAAWPPPRDAPAITGTLVYARRRDPYGDRIQTAFAALYLLTLAMAGTSAKDIAWTALAICSVARLPFIWRCYTTLARDRLIWLLAAWVAWRAMSLLWSSNPAAGFDEFGASRVLLTPLMMWPVLRHATLFVVVFLAGLFGHNLAQLAQALHWFGLTPGVNGRLDGFLHPIHLAGLCLAAMTWHVAALLHRSDAKLAVTAGSAIGLAAAAAGLVFTGSRGPWLAAAVTMPMTVLVIAIRRPPARRTAAVLAAATLVAAVTSWPWTGGFISVRIDQAVTQLRSASTDPADLDTEIGERLGRWLGAEQIALNHPIAGTGAGGYGDAMMQGDYAAVTGRSHHAHSVYLHDAATLGLPGLALTLAALGACLRRAWTDPPGDRYGDGCFFVLAGWVIGGLFDCYHITGTMFGLFSMVIALTMRNPERP